MALVCAVLITVVLVFAGVRIAVDLPYLRDGRTPDRAAFEYRYVTHAALAYTHILSGVVYFLAAATQLSARIRRRHRALHRRLGRVAILAGLIAGVSAVLFGVQFAIGGVLEASATVVFGTAFTVALVLAYRAIRRRHIPQHRRWMIIAFALALSVGTIRLLIGIFLACGWSFAPSFGLAFWLAFPVHVAVAVYYLRPNGQSRSSPAFVGVNPQTSK
jgi:hypothetical protein